MKKVYYEPEYIDRSEERREWEKVFVNPMPIMFETLKTGMIISKLSGILNLKNVYAGALKGINHR